MKIWLPAVRAGSGVDLYTERLASALRRSGHDAVVTWLPIRVEPLPGLSRAQPPEGTDLIHANSWNAFAFARFGKPLVVTAHLCVHDPAFASYKTLGQRLYHGLLIRPYEQRSYNVAQAIVAVSNHTRSSVIAQFGSREITVIHNWVDTEVFRPASGAAGGRGARPFRLLYAGNRSARKGWDVLPELMLRLGPEFELYAAGGLRSDEPKSELPPNTHWLGAIRDEQAMARAYQKCDALIMPSRLEGFGYVTAEAMACGKPVVAFANSAAPEVIADRETGLLVATDDIEGLAVACRQLSKNPAMAQTMGCAGRLRVEEKFSETAAIQRYMRLYAEVLDGGGRRTAPGQRVDRVSNDHPAIESVKGRVFFVSPFLEDRHGRRYGGSLVSRRNLRIVAAAFGTSLRVYSAGPQQSATADAVIPTAASFWELAVSVLTLHCRKLLAKSLRYLEGELRRHRPEVVFLESTLLGRLAAVVQRCSPTTRVISFAQNVEAEFFTSALWMTPRHLLELPAVIRNEALAIRSSHAVIYLSDEDAALAQRLYGAHKSAVFPVTLQSPSVSSPSQPLENAELSGIKVLFVGSPFYANLHAIGVIARKIAPALPDVEFLVAGIATTESPATVPGNVKLLGHVPDLVAVYSAAHAVVLPIYYGAGVKVKVAEALLHGKPVLATRLALRGYDWQGEGILLCKRPQDFVDGIRSLAVPGHRRPNFEQQRKRHDAGLAEPNLARQLSRLVAEI